MSWHPSQADHHDRDEPCGDPDCRQCPYGDSYLDDPDFDMPSTRRGPQVRWSHPTMLP